MHTILLRSFYSIIVFWTLPIITFGQTQAEIYGTIKDALSGEPIVLTTIYIDGTSLAAESNDDGSYNLGIEPDLASTVVFTRIGYKEARINIDPQPSGGRKKIEVELAPLDSDLEIIVRESKVENNGMIQQDVKALKLIPTVTGNLESILPHIALGTTSGTGGELTSQYNVRGGNYDENLVYVNGFEIYRPQLITSGEQEGLSFPNIDLIQSLSFSSGGFEAKYGDKMSSVLDIQYKRPDTLAGSISASLLGGTGHIEGSKKIGNSDYKKIRYLGGARYKTTKYILGTLDVDGEYQTQFTDFQGYVTYDITRDLQVGLLGNYNRSKYNLIPDTRTTTLGLINFALQLNSVFEGQEVDQFISGMGGLSLTYLPDKKENPYYLKLLASSSQSDESQTLDISGFYRLSQIEAGIGAENAGEELSVLGAGTQHRFSRALLSSNITNAEIKGGKEWNKELSNNRGFKNHFLQSSIKIQHEIIEDRINEWERLDSAGYSLPADPDQVLVQNVLKSENEINSNRYSFYLQDTYSKRINGKSEMRIIAGARLQHWDLNNETVISPRVQFLYKPLERKRDVSYRLAAGMYAQPAFYRELRRNDGTVNRDLQSQKSFHIVGGLTYDFVLGRGNPKKFRFISELYYKKLWDLVSYEVNNVRIRYSGENDAEGDIMGLDLRINGEFVPGAESWINLSFIRARERLNGVEHKRRNIGEEEGVVVSSVPRPTDRLFNLNMFFQDYLPSNDNFKVHLNLSLGSGLPFGLSGRNREYRNTYRYATYRRLDIGFSAQLWDKNWKHKRPHNPFRFARNTWLSLEIFNLLGIQNVASNTWIKTITNAQYAVPNELTSRRINLKFKVEF